MGMIASDEFLPRVLSIMQTKLLQDVRPSVTRRYSVETAFIVKHFHCLVATPF